MFAKTKSKLCLSLSPENPLLQVHVKMPGVFLQVAFTSHVWVPSVHSSLSKMFNLKILNSYLKKTASIPSQFPGALPISE